VRRDDAAQEHSPAWRVTCCNGRAFLYRHAGVGKPDPVLGRARILTQGKAALGTSKPGIATSSTWTIVL